MMGAFPEADDDAYADETTDIKRAIVLAHSVADGVALRKLVDELEPLNPTERCATSPLLEGYWETIYASAPADWSRGGRVRHAIEAWSQYNDSPGATGILAGPRGNSWTDVADGRGAYVQRARRRFGSSEVRATYTWLGGEAWDVEYVSRARLLFGVPVWRWPVRAPASVDFDHEVRPTYVDGDACVLRAPAVFAGNRELRPERVYLLRRMKNRLWQDGSFTGLTDKPVFGFDLDP
tara:strand:- start:912 stop:1619 length:708 start_codon:yes stop_codon:yes gene_type:complete